MQVRRILRPASLLLIAAGGLSCANALQNGHSTSLSGFDLVTMTDDMAAKIGADPKVQAAIASCGPLRVVVMPVVNELRAEVIPRGQAVAFTGRVRVLLAQHAPERFTWCMNRDAFRDLQARELDVEIAPGPDPERVNPEYALTATFSSITEENRHRRDAFYECAFSLTNLRDSTLLWNGSYEVKKDAVKGFLD